MSWSGLPFRQEFGLLQARAASAMRTSWIERRPAPRRGGRASAGRPHRGGRAGATSHRRRLGSRRTTASSSAKWVKTWRTRASGGAGSGCGWSVQSPPGSAAMPPSSPSAGRRTSHTAPSRSIHWAMPWRRGRARFALARRKGFGHAAGERGAVAAQAGRPGSRAPSGGRWSRRDPSSPGRNRRRGRRNHRFDEPFGFRSCSAAFSPWSRATTRATLVSIAAASRPKAIAAIAAAV